MKIAGARHIKAGSKGESRQKGHLAPRRAKVLTIAIVQKAGEKGFFFAVAKETKERIFVPYSTEVVPEAGVEPEKLKKVAGSVRRMKVGEIVMILLLQEEESRRGRLRSAKAWCRFQDYNNLFTGP
jgi:hypothetical protein